MYFSIFCYTPWILMLENFISTSCNLNMTYIGNISYRETLSLNLLFCSFHLVHPGMWEQDNPRVREKSQVPFYFKHHLLSFLDREQRVLSSVCFSLLRWNSYISLLLDCNNHQSVLSLDLPILGISCEWNHTSHNLWCLVSFA